MKTIEKVLWGLSGIAFLVGIVGLVQRLTSGHTLAGYGSYVPWGLWVGLYALLVGMSAGSFLLASLSLGFGVTQLKPIEKPALLVSLATFIGGMFAVVLDLGHPLRAWRLFLATGTSSVMGWMAWLYTAFFLLLVVLVWFVVWKKQPGKSFVKPLAILGSFVAILFGSAEGALFGVIGARDFWHSGLTPVLFLVEGALSGTALVIFLSGLLGLLKEELYPILGRLLLGLLGISIILEAAEFFTGYYTSIPAYSKSLQLVLTGPFWWVFWILHVGLGVVAPLVLLLIASKQRANILIGAGLIAVTGLTAKLNLVIAAQAVPQFEELRMAYTGPGLNFDYFPTMVEWLLSVWIVGLVALIALAGFRLLADKPQKKSAEVGR